MLHILIAPSLVAENFVPPASSVDVAMDIRGAPSDPAVSLPPPPMVSSDLGVAVSSSPRAVSQPAASTAGGTLPVSDPLTLAPVLQEPVALDAVHSEVTPHLEVRTMAPLPRRALSLPPVAGPSNLNASRSDDLMVIDEDEEEGDRGHSRGLGEERDEEMEQGQGEQGAGGNGMVEDEVLGGEDAEAEVVGKGKGRANATRKDKGKGKETANVAAEVTTKATVKPAKATAKPLKETGKPAKAMGKLAKPPAKPAKPVPKPRQSRTPRQETTKQSKRRKAFTSAEYVVSDDDVPQEPPAQPVDESPEDEAPEAGAPDEEVPSAPNPDYPDWPLFASDKPAKRIANSFVPWDGHLVMRDWDAADIMPELVLAESPSDLTEDTPRDRKNLTPTAVYRRVKSQVMASGIWPQNFQPDMYGLPTLFTLVSVRSIIIVSALTSLQQHGCQRCYRLQIPCQWMLSATLNCISCRAAKKSCDASVHLHPDDWGVAVALGTHFADENDTNMELILPDISERTFEVRGLHNALMMRTEAHLNRNTNAPHAMIEAAPPIAAAPSAPSAPTTRPRRSNRRTKKQVVPTDNEPSTSMATVEVVLPKRKQRTSQEPRKRQRKETPETLATMTGM